MSTSGPMKLMTLMMDEGEKRRLAELAAERHVTLSYALREGARMYLEEFSAKREPDPKLLRVEYRGGEGAS